MMKIANPIKLKNMLTAFDNGMDYEDIATLFNEDANFFWIEVEYHVKNDTPKRLLWFRTRFIVPPWFDKDYGRAYNISLTKYRQELGLNSWVDYYENLWHTKDDYRREYNGC